MNINTFNFSLKNNISELETLREKLESAAETWGLSQKLLFNINLCLDELVTNIISYGYEDENEHIIQINMSNENNQLTIELIDDAKAFNPLDKKEVDTDIAIEDRQIGGLGIHFVKKIVNELNYQRENNKNILTLKIILS